MSTSGLEEQIIYKRETPIKERLKDSAREGTWKLMAASGRGIGKIINYAGLTIAGAGAGEYFLDQPIGMAIAGTALRAAPWAIRKSLFYVPGAWVGIVYDGDRIFKENEASGLLAELSQLRIDLKLSGEEISADELLYKSHKDKFMRKAKVVGHGLHYRYPGTRYVLIEMEDWRLDPEPRTFSATTPRGIAIDVEVDKTMTYQKLPINFGLANKSILLRKGDWQPTLEEKLIDQSYNLVGQHFIHVRFPEVLQTPISKQLMATKKREIVHKYGVDVEFLNESHNIHSDQEGALRNAMLELNADVDSGRRSKHSFQEAVDLVQSLTEKNNFTPEFFELLNAFRSFRNPSSSLGTATT